MAARDYLLDTGILLHCVRQSPLYESIDAQYRLSSDGFRPMVSVVSIGEIKALARYHGWGRTKLAALDVLLSKLVVVDINLPPILNAYAAISAHATRHGWALHSQKNDLWIAGTAHVLDAMLLTTDKDFEQASGTFIQCTVFS